MGHNVLKPAIPQEVTKPLNALPDVLPAVLSGLGDAAHPRQLSVAHHGSIGLQEAGGHFPLDGLSTEHDGKRALNAEPFEGGQHEATFARRCGRP